MTALLNAMLILAAAGQTPHDETFDRAGEAYARGEYVSAAELYEQLIAEGVREGAVFYNLGNAYFQQGRYGPAIANFERALRRSPRAETAQRNRDLAIQRADGGELAREIPPWEHGAIQAQAALRPEATLWGALGAWTLFWLLLAVRMWRPTRFVSGGAVIALALAAAIGYGAWVRNQPSAVAVTSQPEVATHQALSYDAPERFRLLEGDQVLIDGEEADWLRVVNADGERGWAPATAFTRVGPPYTRAPEEVSPERPS